MPGFVRSMRGRAPTIIIALLAGFAGLLILFPASGVATDPPRCYSILSFVVPCDAWIAWAAGWHGSRATG